MDPSGGPSVRTSDGRAAAPTRGSLTLEQAVDLALGDNNTNRDE